MLSGIGAPDELRAVGVEPRHELPGVGRNLQDHPYLTMLWEISEGPTLYGADKPKYLLEWLLRRPGPLTSTAAEVVAFVRTRAGLPAADIQFHMGALYFEKHGEEEFDGHAMTIAPVLVSPKSRGQVWLRSADPLAKPADRHQLAQPSPTTSPRWSPGCRLAREIAATSPLAEVVVRELKPGADAESPEQLEAALRERLELIYHPVGTCRMSDDGDDAVVDSQLRVHGIDGLRVVDASIFPVIPGGNTNAADDHGRRAGHRPDPRAAAAYASRMNAIRSALIRATLFSKGSDWAGIGVSSENPDDTTREPVLDGLEILLNVDEVPGVARESDQGRHPRSFHRGGLERDVYVTRRGPVALVGHETCGEVHVGPVEIAILLGAGQIDGVTANGESSR